MGRLRPPDFLDKINFVIDFVSEPCDTPWYVYAETMWPALGKMALVLVGFGVDDMVRSFFRPKGLRSARHGRKGRRGRIPSIPELPDEIARRLPGRSAAAARYTDGGTKFLWRLDGGLQRALNHFMLVDELPNFAFNWTSGIITDPASDCTNRPGGASKRETGFPILGVVGWSAIPQTVVMYERGGVNMQGSGCFFPAGKHVITFAITVRNGAGVPGIRESQARLRVHGQELAVYGSRVTLGEGEAHDLTVTAYVEGPGGVTAEALAGGGNLDVLKSDFVCMSFMR